MQNPIINKLLIISWDWNDNFSWDFGWTGVNSQIRIENTLRFYTLLSESYCQVTNISLVESFSKNLNNCISSQWSVPWAEFINYRIIIVSEILSWIRNLVSI